MQGHLCITTGKEPQVKNSSQGKEEQNPSEEPQDQPAASHLIWSQAQVAKPPVFRGFYMGL